MSNRNVSVNTVEDWLRLGKQVNQWLRISDFTTHSTISNTRQIKSWSYLELTIAEVKIFLKNGMEQINERQTGNMSEID